MTRSILAIISCSIITIGCAVKVAPTGGPKDTTPAHVESVSPPSGTRNLVDPRFTIVFDDYVDRSIRNDITVTPRARFNSSYSGDEIAIWFDDELNDNTTYAITLGTSWKDIRGNTSDESTTIVFSTGPDLDSGTIRGSVIARSLQDVVVLLYPRADTLTTAFDPRALIAPYQVPVGSNGTFVIGGLKDGLYRLIAVRDGNKNQLPDADEEYGVASADVRVREGASDDVNVYLGPSMREQTDTSTTDSSLSANLADSTLTPRDSSRADSATTTEDRTVYPGSIEGSFNAPALSAGRYIMRFVNQQGIVEATLEPVVGGRFVVDSIPPGTYTVDVFVDTNNDAQYSHGSLFPFSFAEQRFVRALSIVVRQRWTTENVNVNLLP